MKKRIKWIDIAKGYGIILVIYGHVTNDSFSLWLYTFHVPLFFFLSGYFFDPAKKTTDFIKSKTKGLLLPYLTLGIPLFLFNMHYGFEPTDLLKSYIIQQRASTLWFIAALFAQFIIAYILYRTISSLFYRWIIIGILAMTGVSLWHNGLLSMPWNTDISMVTLPFFCLGHDLRHNHQFNNIISPNHNFIYILVFFTITIIGTIIMLHIPYPTVDLYASQFSFAPFAYIVAIAGILLTCIISNRWNNMILTYIGQNSLVYFVWQQDIAIMMATKISNFLHLFNTLSGISICLKNIFMVVLSLIILTILNEIIIRTKLRLLIGK